MKKFLSPKKIGLCFIFTLSFIFLCFLSGCVSNTQTNILPGINLDGFAYVTIAPIVYSDGVADKYGLEVKLAAMFIDEGLRYISDIQAETFPIKRKGEILFCNLSHYHSPLAGGLIGTYATLIIQGYDILGRRVFYGKGESQGMTIQADLDGALKKAFAGFAAAYIGFNPSYTINYESEIKRRYSNWETVDMTVQKLKNYFVENQDYLDDIEGIWSEVEFNQYEIGIMKERIWQSTRDYVAIITESNTPYWVPKQVKIEFKKTVYTNSYSTTYYMADHSKQGTTAFITDEGLLEMNLRNPDGTTFKSTFIKNFPIENIEFSSEETTMAGTGFIIDESGIILTNYHLVEGRTKIDVMFFPINKSFEASIVLRDKTNDLAILKLSEFIYSEVYLSDIPFSISSSKSVNLGESVFTLGFPLGNLLGNSAKFSTGEISSLMGIRDDPRTYQISNPIQPGNSGSPLFDEKGQLIGIVVAQINAKYLFDETGIIPQNINFAIKSDYFINLISMLPEGDRVLNRVSRVSNKNIVEQIKLLSPFICKIIAK